MPGTRGPGRGGGAGGSARELCRGGICREPLLERRVPLRCGTRAPSALALSQRSRCWPGAARRAWATLRACRPRSIRRTIRRLRSPRPLCRPIRATHPGRMPTSSIAFARVCLTDGQHAAVDRELALYRSQPDLLDRTFRRARATALHRRRDRKARHADGALIAPRVESAFNPVAYSRSRASALAVHATHRPTTASIRTVGSMSAVTSSSRPRPRCPIWSTAPLFRR